MIRRWFIALSCAVLVSILFAAACNTQPPTANDGIPRVLLQVTETSDPDAFDQIVAELRSRNLLAVILIDESFVNANCERITSLADEGYEIMAFIRPEDPSLTLPALTHAEQEALITDTKTAIEACLGRAIDGYRCYMFDQNEDTYQILDALGFMYNLGFVANSSSSLAGHATDTLPYRTTDYSFWAIPMHSVVTTGGTKAFCDMPFRSLSAADWQALLISEFDRMAAAGHPLLVEVHPYFSGVDAGRFDAFVAFLDHAVANGAEFMTTAQYVAWSQSQ